MIAQWRTPANAVTLLRVVLTPVVVAAIVWGHPRQAVVWFAVAASTDFVDGWLARMQRTAISSIGQYFDPIADKLLLSGVFIALAIEGSLPLWFLTLVLGRDLAILIASAIAMRFSSYHDYTPTVWGKVSTALQILAAVSVMVSNAEGTGRWSGTGRLALWTAAVSTAGSAAHYTWRGVSYFVRRPSTVNGPSRSNVNRH